MSMETMETSVAENAVVETRPAEQSLDLESQRFAESNLLSEIPGVIFGLVTLAYIIFSLIGF